MRALVNLNFGKPTVSRVMRTTRPRGSTRTRTTWKGRCRSQHELTPGIGLDVGYYRTWTGGFLAMENLATGAADYDEFCITAPTDSRLGPYSGREVCGLYDVRPALFGQVDNLIAKATNYGTQRHIYNGSTRR